jgi:hypothetical protein
LGNVSRIFASVGQNGSIVSSPGLAGISIFSRRIPAFAFEHQAGACELLHRGDGTFQGRSRPLFAAKAALNN